MRKILIFTVLTLHSICVSADQTPINSDLHGAYLDSIKISDFRNELLSAPANSRFVVIETTNEGWGSLDGLLVVETIDGVDVLSRGSINLSNVWSGNPSKVKKVKIPRSFDSILSQLQESGLESLTDNLEENKKLVLDGTAYHVMTKLPERIRRFSVYAPDAFATLGHCKLINILFALCDPDASNCNLLRCRTEPPKYKEIPVPPALDSLPEDKQ